MDIKDLFQNSSLIIRDKVRNPFFVSFIVALLLLHKDFLLEEFLPKLDSVDKWQCLLDYWKLETTPSIWNVLGKAILLMGAFYIVDLLTHLIATGYTKVVKANISRLIDKPAWVDQHAFNDLNDRYNQKAVELARLENEMDDLRKRKSFLESQQVAYENDVERIKGYARGEFNAALGNMRKSLQTVDVKIKQTYSKEDGQFDTIKLHDVIRSLFTDQVANSLKSYERKLALHKLDS